jgi:hypothetical protein
MKKAQCYSHSDALADAIPKDRQGFSVLYDEEVL